MTHQAPIFRCPDCGHTAFHGPCVVCTEVEIEPPHMRPDPRDITDGGDDGRG